MICLFVGICVSSESQVHEESSAPQPDLVEGIRVAYTKPVAAAAEVGAD